MSHVPRISHAWAGYLGEDRSAWAAYDAVELVRALPADARRPPLLVDTGSADKFLAEQLKPEALEAAVRDTAYPNATLRIQVGGAAAGGSGGNAGGAWGGPSGGEACTLGACVSLTHVSTWGCGGRGKAQEQLGQHWYAAFGGEGRGGGAGPFMKGSDALWRPLGVAYMMHHEDSTLLSHKPMCD